MTQIKGSVPQRERKKLGILRNLAPLAPLALLAPFIYPNPPSEEPALAGCRCDRNWDIYEYIVLNERPARRRNRPSSFCRLQCDRPSE
jgi:hypothetical protein